MAKSNQFLDSLPPGVFRLLKNHLRSVTLKRDACIAEMGRTIGAVTLPVDSIISVITVMDDGHQVESRTIGREGGFGLLHALGSRMSFERVIVQVGGEAVEIDIGRLADIARTSPELTRQIVRHAQATIVQSAQFMACNTFHSTPRRLCRWLLMTQDRLQSDVLPLTHEHLAIMLGVQRTTVTATAIPLQEQKLISYSRGRIRVKDREGLMRGACECYGVLTETVDHILSEDTASMNRARP